MASCILFNQSGKVCFCFKMQLKERYFAVSEEGRKRKENRKEGKEKIGGREGGRKERKKN